MSTEGRSIVHREKMTPRRHIFSAIRRTLLAAGVVTLLVLALSSQDASNSVQRSLLLEVSTRAFSPAFLLSPRPRRKIRLLFPEKGSRLLSRPFAPVAWIWTTGKLGGSLSKRTIIRLLGEQDGRGRGQSFQPEWMEQKARDRQEPFVRKL